MKDLKVRAVMWIMDRLGVYSIRVYIERKNKPALSYVVGWL